MYVTDPTYSYEALVKKILTNNFYSMLEEFEGFYLYGPVSGLRYFDIEEKEIKINLILSSINQFKYYYFSRCG
jgi:hypothetical protein